ncbi:NUDIX domain-containing protein [Paenalcaligenes sp. Me131]|uniref:NUDIX domain-containing protein n=1 Tax=Paenalcaligenes sp. Me131 TaxID=3392636 RepID=UPI003D281C8D
MSKNIQAACGAVIINNNNILLLKRKKNPESNHWGIPGGKIDWMEKIEDAVTRETLEETGLQLTSLYLLVNVNHFDSERNEHWLAGVYLATSYLGEAHLQEPEKHAELGWFPLDNLPTPLTQATQQAVAAYTYYNEAPPTKQA